MAHPAGSAIFAPGEYLAACYTLAIYSFAIVFRVQVALCHLIPPTTFDSAYFMASETVA